MNPHDDQLDRLFRAAAQVRPGQVAAAPFGLETRSLASWHAGRAAEPGLWDMALLVRGLILAGVIMAISFLPALSTTESTTNPFAEYLQLTDSTVSSDETP